MSARPPAQMSGSRTLHLDTYAERYGTPAERYRELAEFYDELFPFNADAEAAVAFIAKLAPGGRMLELGVGTGRIAIPLAQRGCRVVGIDTSPEMLQLLAAKDPGRQVDTLLSDMCDPQVAGSFDVVYAVYNTLFALLTQELQLRCLSAAASHLRDGGYLVIEVGVPTISRRPDPFSITADFRSPEEVTIQITQVDHLRQLLEHRHVHIGNDRVRVLPAVHRYIHVPELDLMARLAGFELDSRSGDWNHSPFDANSTRHVSVYRRLGRRG